MVSARRLPFDLRRLRTVPWRRVLLALAIGALGGALFQYVRMPLAWLLGALTATTVAALAGAPVALPQPMRQSMIAVLGVMIGTTITPAFLDNVARWPGSLALIVPYIALTATIAYVYLRRVAGEDHATACCMGMPGGVNEMTVLGAALGADDRAIALSQAVRLTLVVFTVPIWFRVVEGYVPPALPVTGGTLDSVSLEDLLTLAGCAIVGPLLGRLMRLPAYALVGALLVSGILHGSGLTESRLPPEFVVVAQVTIGASHGCRFVGVALGKVWRVARHGVVVAVMMLSATVGLSLFAHALTGVPTEILILAYAPGGLAEMSIIALSLNADPVFVSTHQISRILIVIVVAPLIIRYTVLRQQRRARALQPAPGED